MESVAEVAEPALGLSRLAARSAGQPLPGPRPRPLAGGLRSSVPASASLYGRVKEQLTVRAAPRQSREAGVPIPRDATVAPAVAVPDDVVEQGVRPP